MSNPGRDTNHMEKMRTIHSIKLKTDPDYKHMWVKKVLAGKRKAQRKRERALLKASGVVPPPTRKTKPSVSLPINGALKSLEQVVWDLGIEQMEKILQHAKRGRDHGSIKVSQ